jgi:hypothetical protein
MMHGQPVRIAVLFEPGKKAAPVWFELNRRQHRVEQSTYHWQDRVGDRHLLHYAVSDGEALYELVFDPADQSWTLQSQQTD